ncbi:MAG: hypothetical protein RLZZ511_4213, partial [Cyanobacteriota bacterium]
MGWLRAKKNRPRAAAKPSKQEIVYAFVGTRLLGTEQHGARPFVRAVRIASAHAHGAAIDRGMLQEAILRAESVLVRRPHTDRAIDIEFYRNLEMLWGEILPSARNPATHFVECGLVKRHGNDRVPYTYRDPKESVFFRGAFTLPDRAGWVR